MGFQNGHFTTRGGSLQSGTGIGNSGAQVVAANLTLTSVDKGKVLLVDTSASRQITLPDPSLNSGFMITIKDATGQANTNNIQILRFGSEKIENTAATKLLQNDFGCFNLFCNGTDWFIIN
jgi:hypothetical protein